MLVYNATKQQFIDDVRKHWDTHETSPMETSETSETSANIGTAIN